MSDQSRPEQPLTPSAPDQGSGTMWKVLTALFAVAAIGFAVWAFTLNADAQDTEQAGAEQVATLEAENQQLTEQVATLEEEKAALEQQKTDLEQGSQQALAEAQQAIDQALQGLDVAQERLTVSEQQVTDATAALQQATDALSSATGDLEVAQAERDQARALAQVSQVCAAGSLSALAVLADSGDAEAAGAEITKVAPACEAAFADSNQPT